MPKSKRAKLVSLTETTKKGLESKQKAIDDLRSYADEYSRIFTFSVHNMRNNYMKDVRNQFKHSRIYMGKNSCVRVALGRTPENEYKDGLHNLSNTMIGQMGVLFTNKSKETVVEYFNSFKLRDYARSGFKATQTVIINEGQLQNFSHAMEVHLRALGLPTVLKKGIITIKTEHTICSFGDTLTPDQANLLKLFGQKIADFQITLEACWSKDGTLEKFSNPLSGVSTRPKIVLTPEDIMPSTGRKELEKVSLPPTNNMVDDVIDEDMEEDENSEEEEDE